MWRESTHRNYERHFSTVQEKFRHTFFSVEYVPTVFSVRIAEFLRNVNCEMETNTTHFVGVLILKPTTAHFRFSLEFELPKPMHELSLYTQDELGIVVFFLLNEALILICLL